MHESTSPELDALAEMQATALDAATAETQGIMQAVGAAGHRIETLGDSITLGIVCLRRCESCWRRGRPDAFASPLPLRSASGRRQTGTRRQQTGTR
jgi:hypothetical protein